MKKVFLGLLMVCFLIVGCNKEELEQTKAELEQIKVENNKLTQLLNDPTKRIPNLLEKTKTLAKELLKFYKEKDALFSNELVGVENSYKQARNDPEIYIDFKKCGIAKKKFRALTEAYKTFAKSYQEFLKDKESELTSSGIEITKIQTNIAKNISNNEDSAQGMEKEYGLIKETPVVIHADKDWQTFGVSVNYGDTVYVVAKGKWIIRYNGQKINANGESKAIPQYSVKEYEKVNLGALICKTGDLKIKDKFGERFTFTAKTDGQLYFRINDNDNAYNKGRLHVTVIVIKKK